jgi:hypothetical protein
MKEFGVKFEQFLYSDFHSLERKLSSVSFEWICQNENLNDKIEFENRLIVAEESEHIFEPKKHDLAGFTRDDGISTIAQYDEVKKAFINGNFRILKKYNPKIIMRNEKQFFMPEVEND